MGECIRTLKLDVPADQAWDWLKDPHNAFSCNMFHSEVIFDGHEVAAGDVVTVMHDFFGVHREHRHARVTDARRYKVAWGEYLVPSGKAKDAFPHTQSYEVCPIDDHSCEIVNRLRGSYRFPGSKYVGERLFTKYMPHILDDDNRVIAVGCGAMEPEKVKTPKGLLVWPMMAMAARFTRRSTRNRMLEEMKKQQRASTATKA